MALLPISPPLSSIPKMLRLAGAAVFLTWIQFQGTEAHPLLPSDSTYLASAQPGCTSIQPLTVTKTVYTTSSSSSAAADIASPRPSSGPPSIYQPSSASLAASSTPTTPTTTSATELSIGVSVTPILQTVAPPLAPIPTGFVHTTLELYPQVSEAPWPKYPEPSVTANVAACRIGNYSSPLINQTYGYKPEPNSNLYDAYGMASSNIFAGVAGQAAPPSQITRRDNHPAPRLGISNSTSPLQTNKFYGNLFLGDRNQSVWTHPYSVSWSKGRGNASSWGLAISHIEREQYAFGPATPQGSSRYFIAPIGIQSMILSAAELSNNTELTVDSLQSMSVNANLAPNVGASPIVTYPIVQGMGFVTGIYKGCTPRIQSSVFFRNVTGPFQVGSSYRYNVQLEDGKNWVFYATPDGGVGAPVFSLTTNTTLNGPSGWRGTIMVAKNPAASQGQDVLDQTAGAYPVSATITGTAAGTTGTYTFQFGKAGLTNRTLLMYALPHHAQSFDQTTSSGKTVLTLNSTTKGTATGYVSDSWTMVENNMPVSMGFAPWSPAKGSVTTLSAAAKCAVVSAAQAELQQNISAQTNLDSMYFSGKGLAKFATIIYAVRDLGGNQELASQGLAKLKSAFAVFVNNQQKNPLVYDNSWKGVVSSAGYTDANADFGNSYYNDHHFHYGYHVYTAAIIAYLDPSWLTDANRLWVNMLVKDFANPIQGDYFPFSRAFDWFHGHSWAKGLFESADGKDQESSSEDAFASYGLKLWGKVIGDNNMEARGNLMLAVQARTFQNYFLMESNNTVQPPQIIGNKVTGILFENKIDWATYFSDAWWCKQGIHMIPVHVPSAYIRKQNFVREEFSVFMSNGHINDAEGGWRGILYSNLALIDPVASYNYFADPSFDNQFLDGGASKTWYLAYTAALGGA